MPQQKIQFLPQGRKLQKDPPPPTFLLIPICQISSLVGLLEVELCLSKDEERNFYVSSW